MANNKIQVKRTSTSGLIPNTTNSGNSKFIDAGELALNMADGILYSSNGSVAIPIGANNVNVNVSNTLIVNAITASGYVLFNGTASFASVVELNGQTGNAGAFLFTNSSSGLEWANAFIYDSGYARSYLYNRLNYAGSNSDSWYLYTESRGSYGVYKNSVGGYLYNGFYDYELYIPDGDLNNYLTLRGPATYSQSYVLYLPTSGPTVNGQVLTSNDTGYLYWSTPVVANNGIVSNSSGVFVKAGTGIVVNTTGVNVNSSYIATISANNASYLGGTLAANYVQNTDSRTLSGNLVISGTYFNPSANTILLGNSIQRWVISGNSGDFSSTVNAVTSVNSALLTVGTSFIANTTGAYHTGTINAASHTIGSTLVANTLGVYHTGTVNAASLTVGTSTIANSTGVYTGVVNGSSHTVGSSFIANSTAIVGTGYANVTTSVNSALLTVGTAFIANTTGAYHTGVVTASGIVSGLELTSTNASGDEGGQINLAKPPNGTTAGGITIDAYQNKLRIFEQGGNARGAYIDLTACANGVGTNLLTGGGGGTGTVTSVGSANGIAGGPITGSGTLYAVAGNSTLYVNASGIHVNLNSQYDWANTQTFQANIAFTGNNISVVSNTGSILFAGASDTNWRIGRSTGSTTKFYYSNNTLDILAAASNLEGVVIGQPGGNTYLETGYAGTFTKNPIYVGNATVNVTINSTAFTGTSNNASYLGGTAAASFVQNTDSRTLSGNLVISGTYFNPSANTILLGNSIQRWVISGNSGDFSSTVNAVTSVNSALLTVGTSFIANTTGAYHTGTMNAASHTVGTSTIANSTGVYTGIVNGSSHTVGSSFIANSTAIVGTGYANVTTSVNSALLTVGTSFIANTTGAYHTGTVNAASHTTTGVTVNATAVALAATAGIYANGSLGTSGQALLSNGTSAYWGAGGGGYYYGSNGTVGITNNLNNIFRVNANTLYANVTFNAGENGTAAGPIAINTGVFLTISTGARVAIV